MPHNASFGAFGSRPSVVFTMVDDLGWELWPRAAGDGASALLPVISEHLRADGLTLARHYAYQNCAPSRQAFLSGRWPVHGGEDNSACRGVPLEVATLADRMAAGGYSTHFVGKWHCGMATRAATPSRRGFGTALGFFGKAVDHYSYCSADAERGCRTTEGWEGEGAGGQVVYDLFEGAGGVDCPLGAAHALAAARTFSTDAFAARAAAIVRAHDLARPLFLLAAFAAPHGPLQAPAARRAGRRDAPGRRADG